MDDRRHKANEHLGVLLASHPDESALAVSAKELVSRLHQLRMGVEELIPAVLAVVLRLVNHVEFVPTVLQERMFDSEVSRPQTADGFLRYLGRLPVGPWAKFGRELFELFGRRSFL